MRKILVTGATGNVGLAIIKAFDFDNSEFELLAGVRNTNQAKEAIANSKVQLVEFDYTQTATFEPALGQCQILFLLRPPQMANVKKYFEPLIESAKKWGIQHIVFLSVQGAQNSSWIPHYKIEKLIEASQIPFTFLRPAYFMQNFTSTLNSELVERRRIYLPAGEAKFTLIDVADVGSFVAKVLTNLGDHKNQSYDLTCNQKLSFGEMAAILTQVLQVKINYESPNLLSFYINQRRQKVALGYILVLILLHFLPRFQQEPIISPAFKEVTKQQPTSFEEFINRNRRELLK